MKLHPTVAEIDTWEKEWVCYSPFARDPVQRHYWQLIAKRRRRGTKSPPVVHFIGPDHQLIGSTIMETGLIGVWDER